MGASQRHRLGNRRVGRPRDPAGHCDSTRWPRHPAALTRAPRPHLREGIALRFSSPLGSSRDERRGGVASPSLRNSIRVALATLRPEGCSIIRLWRAGWRPSEVRRPIRSRELVQVESSAIHVSSKEARRWAPANMRLADGPHQVRTRAYRSQTHELGFGIGGTVGGPRHHRRAGPAAARDGIRQN
jgi:hypothetical protein